MEEDDLEDLRRVLDEAETAYQGLTRDGWWWWWKSNFFHWIISC